ncbi:sarcoplasmic calcium-binding proteins ii, v, vi, and vii [Plakobranchus ocellatus]|uniref:Sarcoplasmic calcium-binding proteins ii, v, vi, and vii n=1 Tax=Plakobranchus ocellatus TaxID=259542 RepID=A0AAV4C7E2_9GAST|nr:sarcoplasmic calcium-binding proteins ii, v, vi, and vii [Plakobranchus ocellatus]
MQECVELSPFQEEKLLYYFKFLEPDGNNVLNATSRSRLMEKIFGFTGWAPQDRRAIQCLEVHDAFFEILFKKAEEKGGEHGTASLADWYAIWSHMLPGVKGMSGFPIWLQLMPKVLFEMIDRDYDDKICKEELAYFYHKLIASDKSPETLEKWTTEAFNQMTDNGKYRLDFDSFEQIFANFLIGRTPHGPGKYIFGCFNHESSIPFTLIERPADSDQ